MTTIRTLLLTASVLAIAAPAWTQAAVTAADLARLETSAGEIAKQAEALEATDATLAAEVRTTLTTLQEEIVYLRVKLRRSEPVTRDEYASLRDRLDTLRIRARGDRVSAMPVLEPDPIATAWIVPVGAALDVRLQTPLNSGTSRAEDRFEATTMVDYSSSSTVVIPAGTVVRGFVSSVRSAGRLDRKGSLTLSFDEMRIGSQSLRLRASVTQAGKLEEDAARIGAGAIVGGIVGGLFGGGKGALLGVLVGAGGTIAATEGTDVDLPAGTVLRIRLDEPIEVVR